MKKSILLRLAFFIIGFMRMRLFAFVLIFAVLPSLASTYVAVVETIAEKGVIGRSEQMFLTDELRKSAKKALPEYMGFVIMTRENIQQMLPPGKKIEDCEGECLVETGKNINADYIAQARVGMFGKSLTLTVEFYETRGSNLVGSFTARKPDAEGLLEEIEQQAEGMFSAIAGGNQGSVGGAEQKLIVKLNPNFGEHALNTNETFSYNHVASSINPSIDYETSVVKGTMTDSRDGQTYKTVKIGNQTWMAENLNYKIGESWCYENDEAKCKKYGRLYSWETAIDWMKNECIYRDSCDIREEVQGVCPNGWHMPSDEEWEKLWTAVGGVSIAGSKLKSKYGWKNGNGKDEVDFSIFPAGIRSYNEKLSYDDLFGGEGEIAMFWSTSEGDLWDYAYIWYFLHDSEKVNGSLSEKVYGASVRCLINFNKGSEIFSQALPSSSSSKVISSSDRKSSVAKGSFTDPRDGQTYKTVKIGNQVWMAENLNYDYNKGTAKSYCYDNSSSNCEKYGRLYTWAAAMDSAGVFSRVGKGCGYGKTCKASLNPSTPVRGVCPSGWHLPSHREFETLINYIDPSFGYNHTGDARSSTAGKYLKSKSGWNSNGNGTDAYGFSALPGGYRNDYGVFGEGNDAGFWSSGEYNSSNAFYLYLYYYYDDAYLSWNNEGRARSVRCLRD